MTEQKTTHRVKNYTCRLCKDIIVVDGNGDLHLVEHLIPYHIDTIGIYLRWVVTGL